MRFQGLDRECKAILSIAQTIPAFGLAALAKRRLGYRLLEKVLWSRLQTQASVKCDSCVLYSPLQLQLAQARVTTHRLLRLFCFDKCMFVVPDAQHDDSAEALAENTRALRRERARLRRMKVKHEERLGLTEEALLLCATIKELAPEEPSIARWSAVRSLQEATDAMPRVRLCLIDDLIEEFRAEESESQGAHGEGRLANTNRRQRAADVIAQHRLMAWVRDVNMSQGIAPSSDLMMHHLQACWTFGDAPDLVDTAQRLATANPSSVRRWFTDWRRRFGITFGRLPPGCELPATEIENQVWNQNLGSKNELNFGTKFWVPKTGEKT